MSIEEILEPLKNKCAVHDLKDASIGGCNCYEVGIENATLDLCLTALKAHNLGVVPSEKDIAFLIYKTDMRHLASAEEIKILFELHYTTWNPKVNEAFVKAKALRTLMLEGKKG